MHAIFIHGLDLDGLVTIYTLLVSARTWTDHIGQVIRIPELQG